MQVGYLIDTNVISELRRREPEPRLVHWIEQRPAGQLYLTERADTGRDPTGR